MKISAIGNKKPSEVSLMVLILAFIVSCADSAPQERAVTPSGNASQIGDASVGENRPNADDDEEIIAAEPALISGSFLTMEFEAGATETEIVLKGTLQNGSGALSAESLAKYKITAQFINTASNAVEKDITVTTSGPYLFIESVLKAKLAEQHVEVTVEDEAAGTKDKHKMGLGTFAGDDGLTSITATKTFDLAGGSISGSQSASSYCDQNGAKDKISGSGSTTIEFSEPEGQTIEFGTANFDCFKGISSSGSGALAAADMVFPNAGWGPFKADGSPACIFAVMSNEQEPSVSKLQIISVASESDAANIIMTIHAHTCSK